MHFGHPEQRNQLFVLALSPHTGAVLTIVHLYSLLQRAIIRTSLQTLPILKTAVDVGRELLILLRVYGEHYRGSGGKNQQGQ
jgi:hypothetical protein